MLAAIDVRIDFSDNDDLTGTTNEEDAVDKRRAAVEPLTLMPLHRLLPIALTKGRCLLMPLTTVSIRQREAIKGHPPRTRDAQPRSGPIGPRPRPNRWSRSCPVSP